MTSEKPKRQPPSRERYQAAHPTIGVHVNRETYARLVDLRERSGLSFGELVKQALGVVEAGIERSEQEAFDLFDAGHEDGHRTGYEKAVAAYRLTFLCSICRAGVPIEVPAGSPAAQAATAALVAAGWGHAECYRRRIGQ